jgi:hypothetical protein
MHDALLRRYFLKLIAAGGAGIATGTFSTGAIEGNFGWLPDEKPNPEQTIILASDVERPIRGSGKNKTVRLWKAWEKAFNRPFESHVQDIGDCVSQAGALAVETKASVQVVNGEDRAPIEKISTEALYIASRIEIGNRALKLLDGSTGAWLAAALEKYGTLFRRNYGQGFDVSKYNPKLARVLGGSREGIPSWLEPEMAKHKTDRLVRIDAGWDQACDFIGSGHPVVLCSSVGFNTETDKYGILHRRGTWNHAMLLWGIYTEGPKSMHAGCIQNSWPVPWFVGPDFKIPCPGGSFWATYRDINSMLASGDCFALVAFDGPRKRKLNYEF